MGGVSAYMQAGIPRNHGCLDDCLPVGLPPVGGLEGRGPNASHWTLPLPLRTAAESITDRSVKMLRITGTRVCVRRLEGGERE